MKFAYTNERMRALDARTIETGTPSSVLMERAGKVLAERVRAVMQERKIGDALFVCGGGNNGGDGFAAARYLREWGCEAEVLCLARKFSPDCKLQAEKFGAYLGRIPRRRYGLIVDCLFGTGLTRAIEGDEAHLVRFIGSGAYIIACDVPSGLAEGGVALEPCVRADETLAMGQLKEALLLADGADTAGAVRVADIGIAGDAGTEVWERTDAARFFPKRKSHTSKGDYGSAAILAGDAFSGAAFLAAGACLKSGAGYTNLYVSDELYPCAVGKLPTVILQRFGGVDERLLQADCVAVGMGMGVSETLYALICRFMKEYRGTLLLDADGLNALSRYGVDALKEKNCRVVLTPHPKEFSRLCGTSVEEAVRGGTEIARRFATENGVTLVLKNNRTIVTDGDRTAIITAGSPALAKGGSGDVLSGFLAGTIARGVQVFDAACCACFALGKAGEYAAEQMGEYAPDAQDIMSFLPAVMRTF